MRTNAKAAAIALALALCATGAAAQDKVFKGDAKCTRCHDAGDTFPVLEIAQTKHGGTAKNTGMTCTSCHGESDRHAAGKPASGERAKPDVTFGKKTTASSDTRAGVCLTCHSSTRQLAFWESGRHKKNDVACDSCHSVHDQQKSTLIKNDPSVTPYVTTSRQLQYETCTSCHRQVRSQLTKPSHHPIIEGKLDCSSCHNPHGALSPAMVKEESINQLCTGCHADQRGPFMQEHAPVEENCLTCHNSHGSIHNKLLTERVPMLCQDCHDAARHPGTYYSGNQGFGSTAPGAPNTRLVNRSCLNCHATIHGSNAPAMRGKFFLR